MVRLTRLNHVPVILNADLIESIEVTPDTVITLVNQQKIRVLETAEQVVERVIAYRRQLMRADQVPLVVDERDLDDQAPPSAGERIGDGA